MRALCWLTSLVAYGTYLLEILLEIVPLSDHFLEPPHPFNQGDVTTTYPDFIHMATVVQQGRDDVGKPSHPDHSSFSWTVGNTFAVHKHFHSTSLFPMLSPYLPNC